MFFLPRTLNQIFAFIVLFASSSLNAQISTFPYSEDFESGLDDWSLESNGLLSWQVGAPDGPIINSAASGNSAIVTNLTGNYFNDEESSIVSPVFNFSSLNQPIVEFSLWWNCESYDGTVFQSSIDNGLTWQNVGSQGSGLNWYNSSYIESIPGNSIEGWSGEYIDFIDNGGSNGWVTASHSVEDLASESNVIFRLAFASDYSVVKDGFGFDDFKIKDLGGLISIPDPQFEQALIDEGIDTDGIINGLVLESDIYYVTELLIDNYNIMSFEGLQYFQTLRVFQHFSNYSTVVNSIDFSGNLLLEEINIILVPSLTEINVSQNINLNFLQLTTQGSMFNFIDVSANENLRYLGLGNNALTNVNLQNNNLIYYLDVNNNPIIELDVSNLSLLQTIYASNCALTEINLQNESNDLITFLDLRDNIDLNCIFVDDASYSSSVSNWYIDDTAIYTDSLDSFQIVQSAQSITVQFDGNGDYEEIVNAWLDNNGGATVNSLCGVSWEYEILDDNLSDDTLTVDVRFIATNYFGETVFSSNTITYTDVAVAIEFTGTGGVLCDVEGYDLGTISDFNNLNFNSSNFNSSIFNVSQTYPSSSGPQSLISGLGVDFPDTGAGKFTYAYKVEVTTNIYIGDFDPFEEVGFKIQVETETTLTVNEVTISFNPGPDKIIVVCNFDDLSLSSLYEQLQIEVDVHDSYWSDVNPGDFEPGNYWFDENDNSITEIIEPGVYKFNPTAFLPECGAETTVVTILAENSETYIIPDQQFEQALIDKNIDTDGALNGQIQTCVISNITELSISGYNISNFDGLQYFTSLERFSLFNNEVNAFHTIDFSGNLILNYININNAPKLYSIDITENSMLTNLSVNTNDASFDGLDLSQNVNLTRLSLSDNNGLGNVQFSNSPIIEYLYLSNTSISNFDTSNFTALEYFDISGSNNISELDLSNSTQLWSLDVSQTNLAKLNLTNLSQLQYLYVNDTNIRTLDVSNNSLFTLRASDNLFLEIVNLKNGVNNQLIYSGVHLQNNPNLSCILVDDSSYSENAYSWYKDETASYTEDGICSTSAVNTLVALDATGNQDEVLNWLNNHGNAIAFSPNEITWEYSFNFIQVGSEIRYETLFNGFTGSDTYSTNATFTISTSLFSAGDNFYPIDEDVANGVAAEGGICDEDTFDLDNFIRFGTPDFDNYEWFENSTALYQQVEGLGTGPDGVTFDGTIADFPDTGAGKFSYYFLYSVSKDIQFFGAPSLITLYDEASIWHWLTIPFDPGPDKTVTICDFSILTLSDLYNELDIVDGTDDTQFNPDEYWFDNYGYPISEVNGPGEYIFNAEAFLPQCGGIPTTVTVISDLQKSAGIDASINICVGETLTNAELFTALGETADTGGTWEEIVTGVYEYSHAATTCYPLVSATVTLIEELQKSAGVDALIDICQGETLTNAELFTALGDTTDTGGTWNETTTGVYEYSHAATTCYPIVSATVTLIEETQKSAGIDASINICAGETLTNAELFTALGDTADTGGTWNETATGVYEYSHVATICYSEVSATVTLIEEPRKLAGVSSNYYICEGEVISYSNLFEALGDTADVDGTWQLTATGGYEYSHVATDCYASQSAIVTVVVELQLSAGENGTLDIANGATVTETELFDALEGSPDLGGTWSPELAGEGTYTYTHVAGICSESSAEVVVIEGSLSIDGEGLKTIDVYPNPAQSVIQIRNSNSIAIKAIEVFNITGQLVMRVEGNFTEINVSKLESAMYFLQVKTEIGQKTVKFIKE